MVQSSPTINDMDDWPRGSHLSIIEVERCLMQGYFPAGLVLLSRAGETFRVVGRELCAQELVKV